MDSQSVQHGFWYYNWGNVASVSGLALTVVTLFFARSASHAARQAREEARLTSHLEGLRQGEVFAKDLANHLASHNIVKASMSAEYLLDVLRMIAESKIIKSNSEVNRQLFFQSKTETESLVALLIRLEQSSTAMKPRELFKAQADIKRVYECIGKLRGSIHEKLEID